MPPNGSHPEGTRTAGARGFSVLEGKPYAKNTLRRFLSLELPSGLILHDCTPYEKNGVRWVGLPAKEYLRGGAKTWRPLIEFSSQESRAKFQSWALDAVEVYLAGGSE